MYTATAFIEVGSLRTGATIYRCEGPLAGVVLFTERAAGVATAGHAVGVFHVACTLQNCVCVARDGQRQICSRVHIQYNYLLVCVLYKVLTTWIRIHPALENDSSGSTGVGIVGHGRTHTLPNICTFAGVIDTPLQRKTD